MGDILDVGKLADPAKVLIEKVSEAIGGLARPYQIVRIAKAEAKASVIRAESEVEVKDISDRAMRRLVLEESRKQANIESIVTSTLPMLRDFAMPQNIDSDWLSNFFDKCKNISNPEMQFVWSRILAGESNSPGSFSRRTVNLMDSIGREDAEMFTRLCSFCWMLDEQVVMIYDHNHKIYNDSGVTYTSMSHLASIGLAVVSMPNIMVPGDGLKLTNLGARSEVSYFGRKFLLDFGEGVDGSMPVGMLFLTETGRELSSVCGPSPVDGFVEYCLRRWEGYGVSVSEIVNDVVQ